MAGRGRGGRGGGRGRVSMSFSTEQLGFGAGEALPGPTLQPPPVFPPMVNRPVPLQTSPETDYLLTLKRDLVQFLRDSPAYLQQEESRKDIERFSDRYQTLSHAPQELELDWGRLPRELRPAARPARPGKRRGGRPPGATPAKRPRKDVDVVGKLEELEKTDAPASDAEEEAEQKEGDDEDEAEEKEDLEEEDVDEEMDEGTDYSKIYFDNGESYLDDEEDNLDDGPVY
ncbi:DNA-directed RNA polymerase III subunit RPC7-like [Bacillus rossius redtenbacheri]|uniref:DNA-directed RNA polymerase III subunit RPC7-like n=1 Tax=Bacillus rossius redtenbacheri TaxID=93214 RepID=UPI002FDD2A7F